MSRIARKNIRLKRAYEPSTADDGVEGIALCTAARHAFDFEAPRATLADLFHGSGSFASKRDL